MKEPKGITFEEWLQQVASYLPEEYHNLPYQKLRKKLESKANIHMGFASYSENPKEFASKIK